MKRPLALHLLPTFCALGLAACAAQPPAATPPQAKQMIVQDKAAEDADDQKGIFCSTEKTLGSNIPRRVCTTPEQREARRKASEADLEQLRKSPLGGTTSTPVRPTL
jgi:hypothetical protein